MTRLPFLRFLPPRGTEIHQIRNNVVIFEDIFLYKHSNRTPSLGEYCILFLAPEPLQLWLNLASKLVSWFCASTKVRVKSQEGEISKTETHAKNPAWGINVSLIDSPGRIFGVRLPVGAG